MIKHLFIYLFVLLFSCGAYAQNASETTLVPVPAEIIQLPEAKPFEPDTAPAAPLAQPKPDAALNSKSSGSSVTAANVPPDKARPVTISRFKSAPVIDGRLDEEIWKQAAVLKDFRQIQPGDNIEPSKQTTVLLGYDDRFLYLGFIALDEPDKVRATIAKRDGIFEDDNVGLFLDTFNAKREAYAFFFNPLGVQADGRFTEGRGDDYSVDIVMESKGIVTDQGYTVEVAIPFKSLRYEAGKGKFWGVHFFRRIKRLNDEMDSWMPISRDKSGVMNQAGQLTGLEGISTERTFELIPSLTLSQTGKRVRSHFPAVNNPSPGLLETGHFVNKNLDFDPGLTAKLGITPTVTLDLALNPDFAQIEADQTVVTANQRFPIFFEEKRPFFLEGIDIFQTRLQPVHTRAIVDPDVAAKLTGKLGRNTFGLLVASDNAPGNFSDEERDDPDIRPTIARFLDKNAYIGVLRLRRDVGSESNIGLIATTYNFIERHNHLGGFDGRFRLDPQTIFSFQVLGTTSRRFFRDPDLGKSIYRNGNAFAYSVRYEKQGRNFGWNFDGQGRTRDYRADVGFTRRTNTNREGLFVRYFSDPRPKAPIITWRVGNVSSINFDWQGRIQDWENEGFLALSMRHQTFAFAGFNTSYERLFEEEFGPRRSPARAGAFFGLDPERSSRQKTVFGRIETEPSKRYAASLRMVQAWGAFDLDFGAGPRFPRVSPAALLDPQSPLDPGRGRSLTIEAQLIYKPSAALRTSLDYTKSTLRRYDTDRVAFDDNIFALRTTYQFTRFIFARGRLDYSTLSANVRGQFLLGWTPNPGTSLYAGYNDDLNRNGFNPFTGSVEPGFRRNGRTFFIKMSYLFRRSFD